MTALHLVDWIIIVIYLATSLSAGIYGRKYVSEISGFIVAGRELGTFIGIATLAATEIGTVTFMYYAELGYKTGFASFINGLIAGGSMIVIGQTGFVIRRLRALRLMTMPEYFQIRYSRNLRVLIGVLVAAGGILNMGVFLKVEGTFLAIISGISLHYLKAIMIGILALELVYTVLGGMVSVVITDFIQYAALSVATLLVTGYCIYYVGLGKMYSAVANSLGPQGFNPFTNSEYGWVYIVFMVVSWFAGSTCWQTTAMRTFSTQDPETSQRVFNWTGVIFLGRGILPMLWGIAALAVFGARQNSLGAMPMLLAKILPTGVLGLVVAGMIAATMSVNSSYLLGWSSIIAQDIVGPLASKPLSTSRQIFVNRVTNVFVSAFVLFWGLWYTLPGPAYFYLTIVGTIFLAGTFVGVVGGLYWKRANTLGAYCATLLGIVGAIFFFFFHVSAGYAGLCAFVLAGVGMIGGSLIGGTRLPNGNRSTAVDEAT